MWQCSSIVDDARVGLARHGVIAAVQRHDTPAIFDWLIDALSYQGVSDNIAYHYMEQHGRLRPLGMPYFGAKFW